MTDPLFRFKRFSLRQERSVMRITTDGVLLGAWARCEGAEEILDIGAGTGLIALMMAQRCAGRITALEPDGVSCEDLVYNIAHSPWSGRITAVRKSLQEFVRDGGREGFDLIVSNPPFFAGDKLPGDAGKRKARHALTLTHEELMTGAAALLPAQGRFCVILPARYEEKIVALAAARKLFCNRLLRVRPHEGKAVSRVLLDLGKQKTALQTDLLTIHSGDDYSGAYKALTKAYYPAF